MNKKRKRIVREDESKFKKSTVWQKADPPKSNQVVNKKPTLTQTIKAKTDTWLEVKTPPPKPVKPVDECSNCKFYFPKRTLPGRTKSVYGVCKRSHVDQQKNDHLWCGEHKPRC